MVKISIILPNYNTGKYLSRCLDSLINQTFQDIEIILIDDGSTDNSVRIMKKYAATDSRIKILEQKNAGAAAARNQGLDTATGQYVMFCDSDDWYESNMCAVMIDTIERKRTDIVCCHNLFDCEENIDDEEKSHRIIHDYFNPPKKGSFDINKKVIITTNVLLWNKIWRRDIIEQYHIRFPVGCEHEDDAFWYMYSCVAKTIHFIHDRLYHYYIRKGSVMSLIVGQKPHNRMDRVSITHYVRDFIQQHHLLHHRDTLLSIYKIQLKCCCSLLTNSEIQQICTETNDSLQKDFHSTKSIHYIETCNEFIITDKKNSRLKIQIKRFWNHSKVHYCKIMKSCGFTSYDKKLQKYTQKAIKADSHLDYIRHH